MPVGFQSIGDSGTVQIDSDFKNYTLASSGTLTLSSANAVKSIWGAMLTVTGVAPIVAFNRLRLFVYRVQQSGNSWTYHFVGLTSPELTNPATFNYYVFDVGYSGSGNNVGLQLFDTTGNLTFDSNATQFPNVVGTRSELPTGSNVTLTFPTGSNIAVVQAQMGWYTSGGAGPGWVDQWVMWVQAQGNSVVLNKRVWFTTTTSGVAETPFSTFYKNIPSIFLFIDVSSL